MCHIHTIDVEPLSSKLLACDSKSRTPDLLRDHALFLYRALSRAHSFALSLLRALLARALCLSISLSLSHTLSVSRRTSPTQAINKPGAYLAVAVCPLLPANVEACPKLTDPMLTDLIYIYIYICTHIDMYMTARHIQHGNRGTVSQVTPPHSPTPT